MVSYHVPQDVRGLYVNPIQRCPFLSKAEMSPLRVKERTPRGLYPHA